MHRYNIIDTPTLEALITALLQKTPVTFVAEDADGKSHQLLMEVKGLHDCGTWDNVADQAGPLPVGRLGTADSWVVIGKLAGDVPLGNPLAEFSSDEEVTTAEALGQVITTYQVFISCNLRRGFGVIGMYTLSRSDGVENDEMPDHALALQHLVHGDGSWL